MSSPPDHEVESEDRHSGAQHAPSDERAREPLMKRANPEQVRQRRRKDHQQETCWNDQAPIRHRVGEHVGWPPADGPGRQRREAGMHVDRVGPRPARSRGEPGHRGEWGGEHAHARPDHDGECTSGRASPIRPLAPAIPPARAISFSWPLPPEVRSPRGPATGVSMGQCGGPEGWQPSVDCTRNVFLGSGGVAFASFASSRMALAT